MIAGLASSYMEKQLGCHMCSAQQAESGQALSLSQFVWQEPLGQVAVFVDKCMRRALQQA